MNTDREILRLLLLPREEGRCTSIHSFTMGDRSTALVSCERDLGHTGVHRQVQQRLDGSVITFNWRSRA